MDQFSVPFISGLGTGVVLGFGFGTVFFALIQNSINHGFRKGLDISIGVVLCDILIISIILFGAQYIDELTKYKDIIKYTGGLLLVSLGVYQFIPHKPARDEFGEIKLKGRSFYIFKGFILNFMNPVNFLAWLAIQTYIKGVNDYSTRESVYFFTGSIIAIFLIEIAISLTANYIGKKLNNRIIRVINITSGYIFIILGLILVFKKI